eukprot:982662-Prymnesium_polylepis.1
MDETLPDAIGAKLEAERLLEEAHAAVRAMEAERDEALVSGPGVLAAQKARDEALQAMTDQHDAYKRQLERLLADQRATFEAELPARMDRQ